MVHYTSISRIVNRRNREISHPEQVLFWVFRGKAFRNKELCIIEFEVVVGKFFYIFIFSNNIKVVFKRE